MRAPILARALPQADTMGHGDVGNRLAEGRDGAVGQDGATGRRLYRSCRGGGRFAPRAATRSATSTRSRSWKRAPRSRPRTGTRMTKAAVAPRAMRVYVAALPRDTKVAGIMLSASPRAQFCSASDASAAPATAETSACVPMRNCDRPQAGVWRLLLPAIAAANRAPARTPGARPRRKRALSRCGLPHSPLEAAPRVHQCRARRRAGRRALRRRRWWRPMCSGASVCGPVKRALAAAPESMTGATIAGAFGKWPAVGCHVQKRVDLAVLAAVEGGDPGRGQVGRRRPARRPPPITTCLRSMNTTGTLHTRPAYDDFTGLRSRFGPSLSAALASPS